MPQTIYMYWTHATVAEPPSASVWRSVWDAYSLIGDKDVAPLLAQHDPDLPRLFGRLAVASPKSDIARFAILYELGGIYMDAHVGPTSAAALEATCTRLNDRELVLFDRVSERKGPDDRHLITGVMLARPRLPLFSEVLRAVGANLRAHELIEDQSEAHVPYRIFQMAGPAVLGRLILDRETVPVSIARPYRDTTDFLPLSPAYDYGFRLYQQYGYREPGSHWSEHQKTRKLFLSEPPPA